MVNDIDFHRSCVDLTKIAQFDDAATFLTFQNQKIFSKALLVIVFSILKLGFELERCCLKILSNKN